MCTGVYCLCVCLAETESQKVIGVELKVADGENLTIGQDFVVKATVTNKSSKARYVVPCLLNGGVK